MKPASFRALRVSSSGASSNETQTHLPTSSASKPRARQNSVTSRTLAGVQRTLSSRAGGRGCLRGYVGAWGRWRSVPVIWFFLCGGIGRVKNNADARAGRLAGTVDGLAALITLKGVLGHDFFPFKKSGLSLKKSGLQNCKSIITSQPLS